MLDKFLDTGNERQVEFAFVEEVVRDLSQKGAKTLLDVGGIPSTSSLNQPLIDTISSIGVSRKVADYRGGDYLGDFVDISIVEKFDIVLFLSSLEHFPHCTEDPSHKAYQYGRDREGFQKAVSLLSEGGRIVLTVPFGKHVWQPYHQNYDWDGIKNLSEGLVIEKSHIYTVQGGEWAIEPDTNSTKEILYTDRCWCVGLFSFCREGE
jgi:hypothetical protein